MDCFQQKLFRRFAYVGRTTWFRVAANAVPVSELEVSALSCELDSQAPPDDLETLNPSIECYIR